MQFDMARVLSCVFLMALVSYLPRVLPVTIFRKPIKSRFIRSFLAYIPYAVLASLTFPAIYQVQVCMLRDFGHTEFLAAYSEEQIFSADQH